MDQIQDKSPHFPTVEDIKNHKEVMQKIALVVIWYERNGWSAPLSMLMEARDKLSAHAVYLGQIVAGFVGDADRAEFERKMQEIDNFHSLVSRGEGVTAASNFCKDKSKREIEIKANKSKEEARLLLSQSNKVLDALQQRISYEKIDLEKRNNNQV